MRINSLELQNYRNIENINFEPSNGVNIIFGENAQGKTNIIEALWLFTGCKSFRGAKDKEIIKKDKTFSKININFYDDEREREAQITIEEKKQILLDGISYDSSNKIFGEFLGMIFAPSHLSLVQGGPIERRKFINMALCQLKPKYANILSDYNKILAQRNQLLKDINYHSELLDTLDIWDERLAIYGSAIIEQRKKYIEELYPFISSIYGGISNKKEEMTLFYETSNSFESNKREEMKDEYLEFLKKSRKEDLFNKTTSVGPHRDDILIQLDNMSVKIYGSQGQKRSCALALKMSEAAVIKKITGKQPVAFLDDVMSELDQGRQDFILNHIEGWQVFITCCNPAEILRVKEGKVFEIKGGKLCTFI
ncbi:MAG: DNA replication/repair protein RecF [Oscillospiraceae bacterium]|nr:DNA replication/repair protein RecF [Oscillospiraceae bacterium]